MSETTYPITLSMPQISILVSLTKEQATKLRYLGEIDDKALNDVASEAIAQYIESRNYEFQDWTSINIFQPIRERIGINLSNVRQIHGTSQAELGKVIGAGQSSISSVENGRSGISLTAMIKLCIFLGCSLNEIITGVPKGKIPEQLTNQFIGRKLKEYRIKSKLSQTELGYKIRCSQEVISNIESGSRPLAVCEYIVLGRFLEE